MERVGKGDSLGGLVDRSYRRSKGIAAQAFRQAHAMLDQGLAQRRSVFEGPRLCRALRGLVLLERLFPSGRATAEA